MKTYKHLYEKLVDKDNVELAINNAFKGKRDREKVKYIIEHKEISIPKYQEMANHYHNAIHSPKVIYDGVKRKKRTIIVPSNDEQVMHHMAVNVLKPIFMKSMYEHSYGSIPNRGAHMAKKYINKWLRNDMRNTRYCLQMDIKKFFESVPHDILKDKLSRIIKDDRFLKILFEIIDVQEVGIPLGFYTSQWFANFYLTELDHIIKEKFCVPYYVRYMDDMVILGGNKEKLHTVRELIEEFLNTKLGLEMKSNWQIFKIEYTDKHNKKHGRPLDFMGFKFYRNRTTLRKSIMFRMSRKAKKIYFKDKPTVRDCRQFISYIGWLSATDTYIFYLNHIKPYITIQYLKRRLSNYDKRIRKELLCGLKQNQKISLA